MLTRYIRAGLQRAHYEFTEDKRFFATISECPGVWAEAETLEACREELASALESWMAVGLRHGDRLDPIDGIHL